MANILKRFVYFLDIGLYATKGRDLLSHYHQSKDLLTKKKTR